MSEDGANGSCSMRQCSKVTRDARHIFLSMFRVENGHMMVGQFCIYIMISIFSMYLYLCVLKCVGVCVCVCARLFVGFDYFGIAVFCIVIAIK